MNSLDEGKYPLLSSMTLPADIAALSIKQKKALAAELRAYILEVVSANGGHLAPSLGVVELTIALHSVFDFPKDKLIWDVGHQCYAHKILSGRAEAFRTLRQKDGISGFPKRKESPYDCFDTGHASTSVSAALGMAAARDLSAEDYEVIAVIGDGALTGGLAFEGLNNAGDKKRKMIVILNDNNKSIADNVGALSRYLAKIRTAPGYGRTKKGVKKVLGSIPVIGNALIAFIDACKRMLKMLLLHDHFFEEMGFVYLGPFDGHDINALCDALEGARNYNGPVLVHVITEKGRGYAPALKNPELFHGVSPFNPADGSRKKPPCITYTDVFSNALCVFAEKDKDIIAVTAAMPLGTGLDNFGYRYPSRFFDVGIAESHAVTFAAGLAAAGKKPVCAIYSSFLQRSYDQILHDVAEPGLPVVFAVDRAGLVGEDGETHQGIFDIAYLRTIPNLLLMAPRNAEELRNMLFSALSYGKPAAIRYPKGAALDAGTVPKKYDLIEQGSWEQLCEGDDFLIVACGSMVPVAMAAAELLEREGTQAGVINARFLNEIDKNFVSVLRGSGKLITIEEGICEGGLYSMLCEYFAAEPAVDIRGIALPRSFITQGDREELLKEYGLSAQGIVHKAGEAGWLK